MIIEFSLAMPRNPMGIPVVRKMVGDALRLLGVTKECVADIQLATSEACSNAVRHGGPAKRYEVMATIGNGRCEMLIADRGKGLDDTPKRLPPINVERGRGILIMKSVVDDVSFDSAPGRGTTVRMRKALDWDEGAIACHLTLDQHAGV